MVLDVGCGIGGPAREMVKFSGVNVIGLNNNDYQIDRATAYARKENLSHKLNFQKGDFMVCDSPAGTLPSLPLTTKTNSKCLFPPILSTQSMPLRLPFTLPLWWGSTLKSSES